MGVAINLEFDIFPNYSTYSFLLDFEALQFSVLQPHSANTRLILENLFWSLPRRKGSFTT